MQASEASHTDEGETPGERGVASRMAVEIAVAAAVALLAAVAIWSNLSIGVGWTDDGPQAGYFPMWIAVIVLACSLVAMAQAWREADRTPFVTATQLRQVGVVLLPLALYVLAIGWLGIYVSSALFLAGFMVFVGRFPWWKSAAFGLAAALLLFWVFEIQFRVPLPKGPVETMLGY